MYGSFHLLGGFPEKILTHIFPLFPYAGRARDPWVDRAPHQHGKSCPNVRKSPYKEMPEKTDYKLLEISRISIILYPFFNLFIVDVFQFGVQFP